MPALILTALAWRFLSSTKTSLSAEAEGWSGVVLKSSYTLTPLPGKTFGAVVTGVALNSQVSEQVIEQIKTDLFRWVRACMAGACSVLQGARLPAGKRWATPTRRCTHVAPCWVPAGFQLAARLLGQVSYLCQRDQPCAGLRSYT